MAKGRIIAGVGIIIGTIITAVHYLRRRPQEGDTRCEGFNLEEYRQGEWVLVETNSPRCGWQPPGEETGLIQGYVVNKDTGAKIPRGTALITIDHTLSIYNTIDELGGYRTPYLLYGVHHFTVKVDNFVMGEFDLEIALPIANFNFELAPLPEAPTPWTESVTVEKIITDKAIYYLGETVRLLMDIQYAYPAPLPADIHGTVLVDSLELTEEWTIDYRNPTLSLEYITTQIGTFTARAQTKSTTFEVVQKVTGTYYMPHGGVRFPTCTELTVDAAILPSGKDWYGIEKPGWGNIFRARDSELIAKLSLAYPSVWSPPEADVKQSKMLIIAARPGWGSPDGMFTFTMPTDYYCQP